MRPILRFVENKVIDISEDVPLGVTVMVFNRSGACLMCGHTPGREVRKGTCCLCIDCICCTRKGEKQ